MKVELLRTIVLYFLTDSLYSFLKVKMFNFQEKCLLLFPKHAKFPKTDKTHLYSRDNFVFYYVNKSEGLLTLNFLDFVFP